MRKLRENLVGLIVKVRNTVEKFHIGAEQLSKASQTLSQGASEEASSLKEITSREYLIVGRRNVLEIKKLLWQRVLASKAEDIGGSVSRTVSLFVREGTVVVSSQNKKYDI